MTDEIRPLKAPNPSALKPLSKKAREENSQKFRRDLADLADEEGLEPEARKRRPPAAPSRETHEEITESESDENPAIGGNLDMRT